MVRSIILSLKKITPSQDVTPPTVPDKSAEPPYYNPGRGDLTIRSTDGIDFHVDKCIIANASLVFADMFSLPAYSTETKEIVGVTEPGDVWRKVLEFCYHCVDDSNPPSLELICALLEVARKYRMSPIAKWMRSSLLRPQYVENKALRTYAIASAYGLADVARVAARAYLSLPAHSGEAKELDLISALQYTRLLEYHKRCVFAAKAAVRPKTIKGNVAIWLYEYDTLLGLPAKCYCVLPLPDLVVVKNTMKTKVLMRIRPAWLTYLQALCERLETALAPSTAREPALLAPVVASVKSCDSCRRKTFEQAMAFADVVVNRIEQAIYTVELEL
ncbi:hypothetical protein C8Q79DRAFT_1015225 [Trametes meyenii]|nr:hypothetical protein C8Q79DRAFT_1015225 [Trametes meyenii]